MTRARTDIGVEISSDELQRLGLALADASVEVGA